MLSRRVLTKLPVLSKTNNFTCTVNLNKFYVATNNVRCIKSSRLLNKHLNNNLLNVSIRSLSNDQSVLPEDPDKFGSLVETPFDKVELDEDEKELENYEKNSSRIPRRFKLSPGQYADLIKDHLKRKDLVSAVSVLDLVKENRDKPTVYMLNLLMRELAIQGDLKRCYKLYTMMKKHGLKPNDASYTCVLNACANSRQRETALGTLSKLREEFMTKNIKLNETHYNTLVKAYGIHHCLLEAFEMVDLMIDNKIKISDITFNALLFASIADKENGLRHALTVWHLMKGRNIKPNLMTYNLLLRAIRDTKLSELKVNTKLIEQFDSSRIVVNEDLRPDLLASPPVVSSLALFVMEPPPKSRSNEATDLVPKNSEDKDIVETDIENTDLSRIHRRNRLILFGGYSGFVERMKQDEVVPNAKTVTLLMEVAPQSTRIEDDLISLASKNKIELDIDFFNMLMKKRSLRRNYKKAQEILKEVQMRGLKPNVMTWGILALGCRFREDGQALLESMEATGHTLNPVIAGALIGNACAYQNFLYIFDIMNVMSRDRIRPSEKLYDILDKFQKSMTDIALKKVKSKYSNDQRFKELFNKFNLRYSSWQEEFGREKRNKG